MPETITQLPDISGRVCGPLSWVREDPRLLSDVMVRHRLIDQCGMVWASVEGPYELMWTRGTWGRRDSVDVCKFKRFMDAVCDAETKGTRSYLKHIRACLEKGLA